MKSYENNEQKDKNPIRKYGSKSLSYENMGQNIYPMKIWVKIFIL